MVDLCEVFYAYQKSHSVLIDFYLRRNLSDYEKFQIQRMSEVDVKFVLLLGIYI